jgi:exonuclease VII large subunit
MQKFTSVTNLFSEIKFGLETQYYLIQVTGEVSKITTIQKGNIFFDIKDENHTVSCFAI